MSLIINRECFTGFHLLQSNCYGYSKLQAYMDRYEEHYLKLLLGSELYPLFINDLLNGVPQDTEYLELFNPFCETVSNCHCNNEEIISKGIKDMITGFVYYNFVHGNQMKQTPVGTTVKKTHNSINVDFLNNERDAEDRWNEAVGTFKAIRSKLGFCEIKEIDYKFLDLI